MTEIGKFSKGSNIVGATFESLMFDDNIARISFDVFGYAMLIC